MDETGVDETGVDETGVDETGVDEAGVRETGVGEPPLGSNGFRRFRRWALGTGSAGTSFSVFEEIFAPTRHQARVEIQAQSRAVKPAPAPTDPPELEPPGPGATRRFEGRVVIRPRRRP